MIISGGPGPLTASPMPGRPWHNLNPGPTLAPHFASKPPSLDGEVIHSEHSTGSTRANAADVLLANDRIWPMRAHFCWVGPPCGIDPMAPR
jgi:hypothetical protein